MYDIFVCVRSPEPFERCVFFTYTSRDERRKRDDDRNRDRRGHDDDSRRGERRGGGGGDDRRRHRERGGDEWGKRSEGHPEEALATGANRIQPGEPEKEEEKNAKVRYHFTLNAAAFIEKVIHSPFFTL